MKNKDQGEGAIDQHSLLTNFESVTNLTAIAAAKMLDTNYNTYKQWKSCNRRMTGPTLKLITVLTMLIGTIQGDLLGL